MWLSGSPPPPIRIRTETQSWLVSPFAFFGYTNSSGCALDVNCASNHRAVLQVVAADEGPIGATFETPMLLLQQVMPLQVEEANHLYIKKIDPPHSHGRSIPPRPPSRRGHREAYEPTAGTVRRRDIFVDAEGSQMTSRNRRFATTGSLRTRLDRHTICSAAPPRNRVQRHTQSLPPAIQPCGHTPHTIRDWGLTTHGRFNVRHGDHAEPRLGGISHVPPRSIDQQPTSQPTPVGVS